MVLFYAIAHFSLLEKLIIYWFLALNVSYSDVDTLFARSRWRREWIVPGVLWCRRVLLLLFLHLLLLIDEGDSFIAIQNFVILVPSYSLLIIRRGTLIFLIFYNSLQALTTYNTPVATLWSNHAMKLISICSTAQIWSYPMVNGVRPASSLLILSGRLSG